MKTVSNDTKLIGLVALISAAAGCWLRGWHDARRHPLGAQRCTKCRRVFRDLEEAGLGDSQLSQARPQYDRSEGSITRQTGF